ncbi:MAG: zinc ribbon domain-containing protein [Elusimicrobiota bacterium]|jgi:hypothetical protein
MIPCPKCSAENDDQARCCDQCGSRLSEEGGPLLEMPCPACDGDVREVLVPMAVCQECGLHLSADGSPAPSSPCREAAAEAPAETAATAEPAEEERPCPVCETPNRGSAEACTTCGLVFGRITHPVTCPRCQAACGDDKCDCGAVLTLSKLLEYVDPSIKVVCPSCKGLFSKKMDVCPDCGAALRSAESLRSFASTH